MNTRTLATFHDLDHARPVVNRLQQAGFHPSTQDESKWQRRHLCEQLASVKVRVEENEYEPARRCLDQIDATEHCLEQAVCCPECGSPEVEYPQITRKFVFPTLSAVLYRLGFVEKEFYCQTCQHTWPTRAKLAPECDPLNWPIKSSPRHENPDMTP